jgi:2-hydroxycyclohexanecarboxyl-CoA dehydrogenase
VTVHHSSTGATRTVNAVPTWSLAGKTAAVTGGANGIGAATVRRLAAAGARVVVIDLDEPAGAALAETTPGAVAMPCDITDYAALRAVFDGLIDTLGGIDVLVNNAGWDRVGRFIDSGPELWGTLLRINLTGLFNATHLALSHMVTTDGGRIVNVASDAGRVGSSGEAVYSACKGGAISFTKSIAREAAKHHITVNCVCPGPTDTPLLTQIKQDNRAAAVMDAIVRATPTRRLAHPDEVADAITFFAAAPEHITGQVLSVSGGLTMAG